jgi:predicted nuclease of restriction endonuclease-like (RecB) superfamily
MNRNEKPRAVRLHDTKLDKEYVQWIYDIKQRFRNAQIKAAVKVNSEQLLFNWQLGRDLVVRKAEEKWGNGIVEQVSLDLQAAFPEAKGFSARNLWNMKKWYSFYTSYEDFGNAVNALSSQMDISSLKLQQVAAEIQETASEEKLQQVVAEIPFPAIFGFIPWGHHIEIITKCKDLHEALFYVKRTIEEEELSAEELQGIPNIVPVQFTDGAYYNFPDDWKCPRCKQPREKFNRA